MLKNLPLRQSSDLTFTLLVSIFVVASLSVAIIFPQADVHKSAAGSEAVVTAINLMVFGLIIILFTVTFMFVRLMLLFRENQVIKKNWLDRLNQVEANIETTSINFNHLLEGISKVDRTKITGWFTVFRRLCEVELLLDRVGNSVLRQRYETQKERLNAEFAEEFFSKYPGLAKDKLLSPDILPAFLENGKKGPLFILVVDGLRLDHWLKISSLVRQKLSNYRVKQEQCYFSVLPSITPYARNSLLSGLNPYQCAEQFYNGELKNNQYEETAFFQLAKQHGKKAFYLKAAENDFQKAIKGIKNDHYDLKTLVFMFVDGLAHSMTNTRATEKSFRDHVLVEFQQDAMQAILDKINEQKGTVLLTSDHGSKLVTRTKKLEGIQNARYLGEKSIFPQRYAVGTIINRNKIAEGIRVVDDVKQFSLPGGKETKYLFMNGNSRFQSKDNTPVHEFVHGGISMEEVIVPKIVFESKG
ncbi:PglZ domain-containing protein [Candidatus Margulisiibacteriota bacterium]